MEASGGTVSEAKYQKLASEYSKLRAKANVLKKAILEEQAKEAILRDNLRQRDTEIRRSEQEIDSLNFRNKQLELRVGKLQQELTLKEEQRSGSSSNRTTFFEHKLESGAAKTSSPMMFEEELQRKVVENAQLTSLIDDKERDLLLYAERISSLEETLKKRMNEQSDTEKKLRKDIEFLQCKNSELETKLMVEAASLIGSEDTLSATGSDNTPIYSTQQMHQHPPHLATANESVISATDRLSTLEREVAHWRSQYELAKLNRPISGDGNQSDFSKLTDASCGCSTTASGLTVKPIYVDIKSAHHKCEPDVDVITKEQLIFNHVSKKFEELLRLKCLAESRFLSFETEVEHLQNCLENATYELKTKDDQVASLASSLNALEEDLTTTRLNYDEQISVLTEQIISLSDQLALANN